MRRSTAMALVLINGGVIMGAGYGATRYADPPPTGPSEACLKARALEDPQADTLCASSSTTSHRSSSGSHWYSGWSSSSSSSFADGGSTSSRGGFGGTAAAHASSSSGG